MRAIIDTGFWYSLLGTREIDRHNKAMEIYEVLKARNVELVIPYPTLYEAINTKLLRDKNRKAAQWFIKQLNSNPKFCAVPDDEYAEEAYALTIKDNPRGISFVDNILRVMVKRRTPALDMLVSFNPGDFVDICAQYNVLCIDQNYKI